MLSLLHIKLGLIKQFVKAMDKTDDGFNFLKTKFPLLSEAEIKEAIFVGPQIRQHFKDSTFMKHLNRKEKRAWLAFKNASMLAEYCWSLVRKTSTSWCKGKQAPDEGTIL
ncbi:hypothetical protein AVEN_252501-1 [Araneus ventricosus]|uniref:Uncharacterized protein n=1 Tax=Araneus ventricosus TaxID=182803 RepID=A0A4Y2ARE3_ARAVE|nr:hypothetical protein AVEN_252501-1 [Araneus ventricosus]